MPSSTRDFSSIEAAQKWLDANPHERGWYRNSLNERVARCQRDCQAEALYFDSGDPSGFYWTRLKMASRRLSNALAFHQPRTFA